MAKLKKNASTKKRTAQAVNPADLQAKAEQMSRSLVESAQQIWMAGVGAFTRAQGGGSKLFDTLVKEGKHIERNTRKLAGDKVDAVRDVVGDRVGVVRERASDTWDRLEKVFEDRVQRALTRLGVPSREDLSDLLERVDALTRELRKSAKSAAPAKSATKKPVSSTAGKQVAASKSKSRPRKTLPKAAKPLPPQA